MIPYHDVEQQSDRWWELRNGIATASEFHRILNPTAGEGWICLAPDGQTCGTTHTKEPTAAACCKKANAKGGNFTPTPAPPQLAGAHRQYAAELVAERLTGGPKDVKQPYQDPNIIRGITMEPRIRAFYEYQQGIGVEIKPCGFIHADDQKSGCSPDGLVWQDDKIIGGLEIKAPSLDTLLLWHEDGGLPQEHKVQVHGCLAITGLPWWDFLAVHLSLPGKPLLVRVTPDDFTLALKKAIDQFNIVVDEMEKRARE